MNMGQQILVIAAIVLLSLATLNVFKVALGSQKTFTESEIVARALYIGQNFIEEAKTKFFDANSATAPITSPDQLTSGLGRRNDEFYPQFNDVDDYHNFDETIIDNGESFHVQITVFYVDKNSGNYPNQVYYRTYQKRFKVRISHRALQYPLVLNHVFTYY
jgi:hypothetical protein